MSPTSPDLQQTIQFFIGREQEGLYLTIPFVMPPGVESFSLTYRYPRYREREQPTPYGCFTARQEINIIDLGILDAGGAQVGASGSDKTEIRIGETQATPGYQPCLLSPGEWRILVGAYKVAPEGVTVEYTLTFTPKVLRLFKGDLHSHTLASDGVLPLEALLQRVQQQGLDFLAITDHNQAVSSATLRQARAQSPGTQSPTLIPGLEWTHYRGHANFLGVDRPYDESFAANTPQQIQARFDSARARRALIVINHPFDEACPFLLDLETLPFDCLEIWNGPMRAANLRAIAWWQAMLVAGQKVPVCGGSDYHHDHLFIFPGAPATCVYAMSASPADLLAALRQGHAYITFAPDGPGLEMTAGEAILGDSVPFSRVQELHMTVSGILAGDVLQVVTAQDSHHILTAEANGSFQGRYTMQSPGFARLELLRSFAPELPRLPALVSNPIYFDAESGIRS